jgi:L-serine dehydratase
MTAAGSSAPSAGPALSLFDILGPVMIGPSSSHTAGAARIGLMGRRILGGEPVEVELAFYGSLAKTYKGHMTDTAVVAGLLGMSVDEARLPQALEHAAACGVRLTVRTQTISDKNPNTIEMMLRSREERRRIVGISVGGGEILMTGIDDYAVRLDGKQEVLLILAAPGSGTAQARIRDLAGAALQALGVLPGPAETLYVLTLDSALGFDLEAHLAEVPGVRSVRRLPRLYEYATRNPQPLFSSIAEMLGQCRDDRSLPEVVIAYEAARSGLDGATIRGMLGRIWQVMQEAMALGLRGENRLVGGLMDGRDGARLLAAIQAGRVVSGPILSLAVARALASMEVNAAMGRVVAAPTAGACGVLPGAISAVAEARRSEEREIADALLVAAMYGVLIARLAPVSGALGGCQSEIGVASAMTAAGCVQLAGGTAEETAQAMALALKSVLGMACDPVAGPVEVPCIKRNAIGVANALAAADMALAGIRSVVPPDEVILALRNVQTLLPMELRDTTLGGLGMTPTAQQLTERWMARCKAAVPPQV